MFANANTQTQPSLQCDYITTADITSILKTKNVDFTKIILIDPAGSAFIGSTTYNGSGFSGYLYNLFEISGQQHYLGEIKPGEAKLGTNIIPNFNFAGLIHAVGPYITNATQQNNIFYDNIKKTVISIENIIKKMNVPKGTIILLPMISSAIYGAGLNTDETRFKTYLDRYLPFVKTLYEKTGIKIILHYHPTTGVEYLTPDIVKEFVNKTCQQQLQNYKFNYMDSKNSNDYINDQYEKILKQIVKKEKTTNENIISQLNRAGATTNQLKLMALSNFMAYADSKPGESLELKFKKGMPQQKPNYGNTCYIASSLSLLEAAYLHNNDNLFKEATNFIIDSNSYNTVKYGNKITELQNMSEFLGVANIGTQGDALDFLDRVIMDESKIGKFFDTVYDANISHIRISQNDNFVNKVEELNSTDENYILFSIAMNDMNVIKYTNKKRKLHIKMPLSYTIGSIQYTLISFIEHIGEHINSGHYTAYIKKPKVDGWWECNDAAVFDVDISEPINHGYVYLYARTPQQKTIIYNEDQFEYKNEDQFEYKNEDQFEDPLGDPFEDPLGDPLGDQYEDQFEDPLGDPLEYKDKINEDKDKINEDTFSSNKIGLGVLGIILSEYWKQITYVLCIVLLLYIIYPSNYTESYQSGNPGYNYNPNIFQHIIL